MPSTTIMYTFEPGEDRLRPAESAASRPLRWAAWHPDGSWCLLAGNGGTAQRFNGSRAAAIEMGTKHNLRGAAFAPDGAEALLAGNRGAVLLWDGSSVRALASPTKENLRRIAYHPGGTFALIVGNAGTVLRYDRQASSLTPVPGDRAHTLRAIAWQPDGAYALIGAYASRYAGYPQPHALYRCDGRYVQSMLATDEEDDFVAVEWHPSGGEALIAGYAYRPNASVSNKLLTYDGRGFTSHAVEAPGALLGASWQPDGEYALLCGEGGTLLRYRAAGGGIEQLDAGTRDNLVGPFWRPDGASALVLRGPSERVYTV